MIEPTLKWWQELGSSFALLMVLEGILPLSKPELWREAIARLTAQSDKSLRKMGLRSMILGVILLCWIRNI